MPPKATVNIGDIFITNKGSQARVISYETSKKVTVEFNNGSTVTTQVDNLRKGRFKSRFEPSLCGVGFLGKSGLVPRDFIRSKWEHMINRCYSPTGVYDKTHKGCSVVKEWHDLYNFEQWVNSEIYSDGFELDKDLLTKGNKVYGPDNCLLIPKEVNSFVIRHETSRGIYPIGVCLNNRGKFNAQVGNGSLHTYLGSFLTPELAFNAYKLAKEQYGKILADKWEGKVNPKVIDALLNFNVEMTD